MWNLRSTKYNNTRKPSSIDYTNSDNSSYECSLGDEYFPPNYFVEDNMDSSEVISLASDLDINNLSNELDLNLLKPSTSYDTTNPTTLINKSNNTRKNIKKGYNFSAKVETSKKKKQLITNDVGTKLTVVFFVKKMSLTLQDIFPENILMK